MLRPAEVPARGHPPWDTALPPVTLPAAVERCTTNHSRDKFPGGLHQSEARCFLEPWRDSHLGCPARAKPSGPVAKVPRG